MDDDIVTNEKVILFFVIIFGIGGGVFGFIKSGIGGLIVGFLIGATIGIVIPTLFLWLFSISILIGFGFIIYSLWGVGN